MNIHSYLSPTMFERTDLVDSAGRTAFADGGGDEGELTGVLPCLRPRDETIFWMTAAAEVEHFLMVHYLFAAYSISPNEVGNIKTLRDTLLQIAREEMGHLITVQNLLTLLGAPLHFGREHSPFASEIYPFRFRLERVSLGSLAKYTLAESPVAETHEDREKLKAAMGDEDFALFESDVKNLGIASNDGRRVRNVGPIFARLKTLFAEGLEPGDLRLDRADRQARWEDWGYKPRSTAGSDLKVLVHRFEQKTFEEARDAAIHAIEEIGEQGEDADLDSSNGESHFERFFEAFKILNEIDVDSAKNHIYPVATNPNVTLSPPLDGERSMLDSMLFSPMQDGRITNPRTRKWAHLFNLRYRLLLRFLNHALVLGGPVFVQEGELKGDRTTKGIVTYWTFKEMRRVKKLAEKLVQMPLTEDENGPHAGPPFELPYQLDISTEEIDRWTGHADVYFASTKLVRDIVGSVRDKDDSFLAYLLEDDVGSIEIAKAVAEGVTPSGDNGLTEFRKVMHMLDESVRGFPVNGFHGSFWRDVNRKDFMGSFINPIVSGKPDESEIIQRIELPESDPRQMPVNRPRIDQIRLDYIRDWVGRDAPDSEPPSQIGIETEPQPDPETNAANQPIGTVVRVPDAPSFEEDIKSLFREVPDRTSMRFLFDLHDYEDVKANADGILKTLEDGSMPCTGRWPDERIQIFRNWITTDYGE